MVELDKYFAFSDCQIWLLTFYDCKFTKEQNLGDDIKHLDASIEDPNKIYISPVIKV